MRFKLDENIGVRGVELLKDSGHDVCTVRQQQLEGASDQILFDACVAEGRALITLDHDFGQVLRFPPQRTSGIAILELGPHPSLQSLLGRIRELVEALKTITSKGRCGS